MSTKRRLESAKQPPKKKQKVSDDIDLQLDAALQSIQALYDDQGTTSSINMSKIENFKDRLQSLIKNNDDKKTELAYRKRVREQIKRLCNGVSSSDFCKTMVKGLRFINNKHEDEFNDDWNQNVYKSTHTADIALKARSPNTNYIRMMRDLLTSYTFTDSISDIISEFCCNDFVWYRISTHESSTDSYRDFESSGFRKLAFDVDDQFRDTMFYKPRADYNIGRDAVTVTQLRQDLDDAMAKLSDRKVNKFFADVCKTLFNTEWKGAEKWILEQHSCEEDI